MSKSNSYIKRPLYLNKIKPFIDKDVIKVFKGQRRVGKSYLLLQAMDYIKEIHPQAIIIYINKELDEFWKLKDAQTLLDYVKEKKAEKGKTYLFIDEIQDIQEFEKALRSLLAEGLFDIYCTGSNAKLLSGELATLISGRYIEIEVFGLSYLEFLDFYKVADSDKALENYLHYGGLPFLIHLPMEDAVVYEYLKNIYQTILLKDVVSRFNIRNVAFLERLVRFLGDNIGSLVSSKKISDFLKSQQVNISPQVVLDYLNHIVSACFIYKVSRTDIEGKKVFEVGEKYYFEDIGMRNAIVGYKTTDIGKIMENVCYKHLRVCGYNILVGISGEKEIDFVCEKQGEKVYLQVCYLLSDEKTIEREYGNLLALKDNYPKIVVSMDAVKGQNTYQGIHSFHLREFLITTHFG